ncbi:MAG: hypothetical protein KJZ91_24570 [Myxococcales bacterium]|nr:hypothetical protein [Myxococcales bacterium]
MMPVTVSHDWHISRDQLASSLLMGSPAHPRDRHRRGALMSVVVLAVIPAAVTEARSRAGEPVELGEPVEPGAPAPARRGLDGRRHGLAAIRAVGAARAVALAAVAALATAACGTDSDRVSRRDCERLRDHVIELRMSSGTADHDQHRAALRAGLGDGFVSSCVEQRTGDGLRCALAARDDHALAACERGASAP